MWMLRNWFAKEQPNPYTRLFYRTPHTSTFNGTPDTAVTIAIREWNEQHRNRQGKKFHSSPKCPYRPWCSPSLLFRRNDGSLPARKAAEAWSYHFNLFRRLWMSKAMPPLSHMLPWRVQEQHFFYIQSYPKLNRSALTSSTPTPSTLS